MKEEITWVTYTQMGNIKTYLSLDWTHLAQDWITHMLLRTQ